MLDEFTVAIQPGHLVFILVGEHLEVVTRHGLAQQLLFTDIGLAHAFDQLLIAPRITGALVQTQLLDPIGNDFIKGFGHRLVSNSRTRQLLDRRQIVSGATAPKKRLLVELHSDVIQLDGLVDGLG